MIRAMVIMILAGLTFLRGLPDGMAYNPHQCQNCPTPTALRQHRKTAPEPTVEATPTPTPTEEPPSVCIQDCKAACKEAGLKWKDCKDDCDCW